MDTYIQSLIASSSQYEEERNYWLEKLSGDIQVSGIPIDYLSYKQEKDHCQRITFEFPDSIYKSISKMCNQSEYGIYVLLLTCVKFLLWKYTSNQDVLVGMPVFTQDDDEEYLDNVLALRSRVDANFTLKELISEVKKTVMEADANQNYPIYKILEQLGVDLSEGTIPIFRTIVLLDSIHNNETIEHIKTDCKFIFSLKNNSLRLEVVYNDSLYQEKTIARVFSHMVVFFSNIKEKLELKLDELEILSEEEMHKILYEFNHMQGYQTVEKSIHQLFEEQAEKTPDNIGVVFGSKQLTYKELNTRANNIAKMLRSRGVGKDSIVAIISKRSLEMMVGILAILKSGGAYLPINPDHPVERIKYMLEDSNAKAMLIQNNNLIIQGFEGEVINLEDEEHYIKPCNNLKPVSGPEDLAYVMYTSGSTGNPKGVMIEHQSAVNILLSMQNKYPLNENDTFLLKTIYTFDISVAEIFGWFLSGGRLTILPPGDEKEPLKILEAIYKYNITHINFVPTMLNEFLDMLSMKACSDLKSLRYIFACGEVLSINVATKFHNMIKGTKLENLYGPTEATIYSTWYSVDKITKQHSVPIGKPLDNYKVYILGKNGKINPIGVAGELCLAGIGLARGYMNREKLTDEKFICNPYDTKTKIYLTGDLARWMPDGNIEFLGRIDYQVKIKGFRIELGEIETQLLALERIKEVVVVARDDYSGNKYLCAYMVLDKELDTHAIVRHLSQSLPDYMIPSYFIRLEKLPLSSNGKVDRKALPAPTESIYENVEYTAPSNSMEEELINIITDVLHLKEDRIGVNHNFFSIGLDSIKSLRVISAINKRMGIDIELAVLYNNPTVRVLAQFLNRYCTRVSEGNLKAIGERILNMKDKIINSKNLEIDLSNLEDIYPLSDIEHGMVYHSLRYPDKGVYHNQSIYLINDKEFNPLNFNKALELMSAKHPILRTAFILDEFIEPLQIVYQESKIDIDHEDISYMNSIDQHEYINEYLCKDRKKPFTLMNDLSKSLWRVRTFDLGEGNICFCLIYHHAILDGWSVANFISELLDTYLRLKINTNLFPPKLKNSYKEFVIEQLAIKENEEILRYWKDELLDYKKLNLEFYGKANLIKAEKYITQSQKYKNPFWGGSSGVDKGYGTDLRTLCFAAYACALNMLSYENDIVVGLVEHNRPVFEDSEKILGCFLNTLPVRVKFRKDMTWESLIEEMSDKLIKLKTYGKLSLFEIHQLTSRDSKQGNPLFDTFFNYVDFKEFSSDIDIKLMPNMQSHERKNTLIDFTISADGENLEILIGYVQPLIPDNMIEKLLTYFINALKQMAYKPKGLISKASILSEKERRSLLYEFNNTNIEYPIYKTLHQVFQEQVSKTPNRIAVVFNGKQITYKELNHKSNSIAKILRDRGVKSDNIVAIMSKRSLEMLIGILGILKAGGAYLPIDPNYPNERIMYMLEDSNAKIMLTQDNFLEKVEYEGEIVNLNREDIYQVNQQNLTNINNSKNLAYVIYTSGSTGKPKGTMIEHYSVINRINWMQKKYPIGEDDVILHKTPFTFDVSVWELFWWAFAGAKVSILEPEGEKDPWMIAETIKRDKVTTMHFVPSMLNIFLEHLSNQEECEKISTLRQVFSSGEALTLNQVKQFNNKINSQYGTKLSNLYGPTEATVDVSYFNCSVGEELNIVPIGKPIDNIKLYVLDKHKSLQPIGVPGELCIAGDGLARGYLNRPELTSEKFVMNPFMLQSRLYCTGDLARWMADGNIEYLGRIDHQVKIRGFRIELGEIEARLLEIEGIRESVVIPWEDSDGSKYLCAYIISDNEFVESEIRESLSKYLPDYMVPSYFIRIEKMPLSHNGKLERKSLPEPSLYINTRKDYIKPRNETEKKLLDIWCSILNIEEIGIDNSFFDIGGHSLKATVLVSKIRKEFSSEITLRQIFQNPTIRKLAEVVNQASKTVYPTIKPVEKKEYYHLSSSQRRMYTLCQLEGNSINYNMPQVMMVKGELDVDRFTLSFNELVKRHETLRTSFELIDGKLVQKIHENLGLNIEYKNGDIDDIDRIIHEFIRPFDLSEPPLLRVSLVRISENKHLMLFDMHHIISDGVSMGIMVKEFISLYEGKKLPQLSIHYKDYAEWENMLFGSDLYKRQEEYWLSVLSGEIPELRFPLDYPRTNQAFESRVVPFELDAELTKELKAMVLQENVTLYILLLSAYYVLLHKFTGQEDYIIGAGTSGRRFAELEGIIGMFVGIFALRNCPKGDKSFSSFLKEVKESVMKLDENQDYPFDDLIKKLGLKREFGRVPLQDTMFILQNMEIPTLSLPNIDFVPYKFKLNVFRHDIALYGVEKEDKLAFYFEYSKNLFAKETIEKLSRDYKRILEHVVNDNEVLIRNIDTLDEIEKDSIIKSLQDTKDMDIEFDF